MAYLMFAAVSLIWGGSFILMKKAAICFTPTAVGAWRVIGGAAVLAIFWFWQGRPWTLRRRDLLPLIGVVLVGYVWPYSIQPALVARHGSGFIGMSVSFVPLLTILISLPVLHIRPTRRQVVGVLGALVCMGALLFEGLDRAISLGDLGLAATVPLGYALANTAIRRLLPHVPTLHLSFFALVLASMCLLPAVPTGIKPATAWTSAWWLAVGSLAILGVLGTGLAAVLFNGLIQQRGPLFAGMVTNLVPVGAVLLGWADGEAVTPLQVAALTGILAMVALVQYPAGQRQTLPPTQTAMEQIDRANRPIT